MVSFDLEKINQILDELKQLPKLREVRELQQRLTKEKVRITKTKKPQVPTLGLEQTKANANIRRSILMKKKWAYIKLIYDSYPILRKQFSIRDVFSMFHKRRRGEDVSIGDVFWQNPSA